MIVSFRYLACCEKIHYGCVSCVSRPVRGQVLECEPLKLNQAECWKFIVLIPSCRHMSFLALDYPRILRLNRRQ